MTESEARVAFAIGVHYALAKYQPMLIDEVVERAYNILEWGPASKSQEAMIIAVDRAFNRIKDDAQKSKP